jgi:hypothetical protein
LTPAPWARAVKAHKLDLFDRLGELVCAREVSEANPSRDPARTAEEALDRLQTHRPQAPEGAATTD